MKALKTIYPDRVDSINWALFGINSYCQLVFVSKLASRKNVKPGYVWQSRRHGKAFNIIKAWYKNVRDKY